MTTVESPPTGLLLLRVGVVADTHVPDRVKCLHPRLLPALEASGVNLILHAGDVCVPDVLTSLGEIAPVMAVRGNRDWAFYGELPLVLYLTLAETPVALLHGHGGWWPYLVDKWKYLWKGYEFERYRRLLEPTAGEAKVVVFGHTHWRENRWCNGRLFFNPGSASLNLPQQRPSYGILNIYSGGLVSGQIYELEGTTIREKRHEII